MKIAIQGHPTRGKEVIQILESLGGQNIHAYWGHSGDSIYYYINQHCKIVYDSIHVLSLYNYKLYTLEEFEKEFPFKIGDRVISKTTDFIGTITKLKENGCYHVKYDNGNFACTSGQNLKLYKEMERNITLTLDKAKEWYKKGGELKEIALQAFSEEELTKVDLPRSWEEFCKNYPKQKCETYIGIFSTIESYGSISDRQHIQDKNVCPSGKSAEAHLAMIQLEQLRDCWRQGWEPNWLEGNVQKYVIQKWRDKISIETTYVTHSFLSFPTYEMAEEFLKCFRDLIKKAGDLI